MGFYEGDSTLINDVRLEMNGLMARGVSAEDIHNALLTAAEIGMAKGLADVEQTEDGLKATRVDNDLSDVLQMLNPDDNFLYSANRLSPS